MTPRRKIPAEQAQQNVSRAIEYWRESFAHPSLGWKILHAEGDTQLVETVKAEVEARHEERLDTFEICVRESRAIVELLEQAGAASVYVLSVLIRVAQQRPAGEFPKPRSISFPKGDFRRGVFAPTGRHGSGESEVLMTRPKTLKGRALSTGKPGPAEMETDVLAAVLAVYLRDRTGQPHYAEIAASFRVWWPGRYLNGELVRARINRLRQQYPKELASRQEFESHYRRAVLHDFGGTFTDSTS